MSGMTRMDTDQNRMTRMDTDKDRSTRMGVNGSLQDDVFSYDPVHQAIAFLP
jgi:hypothetical protein